jgi:hypothetical protein
LNLAILSELTVIGNEGKKSVRITLIKHLLKASLWVIVMLLFTACNPTSTPGAPIPTLVPNPGDTPASQSSPIATDMALPVPSDSSIPTIACFITYDDPFAFMPDSPRLLVRAGTGVQLFNLQTMQEEAFIQATMKWRLVCSP